MSMFSKSKRHQGKHKGSQGKRGPSAADERKRKRNDEAALISRSEAAIAKIPPYSGLSKLERRKFSKFLDLPLAERTLDGLASCEYEDLTAVQQLAIPQALRGGDLLVAAPTGSGKTLAFVVPVVEKLWRAKWSVLDGLGCIILTPTRELAVQIFEVVTAILKMHRITAGLIIGGKDLDTEQRHISRANILVATPGRLLQHMDESVDFYTSNVQTLVLDEADRILDLGFQKTLTAIIDNLPKKRQTLLFSATQAKSVKALVKLSLQDPQYIAVSQIQERVQTENTGGEDDNAEALSKTPDKLVQFYSVVDEASKLNVLWSFITSHLSSKILVFLTSSKQVRFVFETFRRMRPGLPLLHLFGRMKLQKRTTTYGQFSQSKAACLFATDVAARGLDFDGVDWVVQMDCPDTLATYIHRVGRTARYTASGKTVLFLLPSEQKFIERLKESEVPVKKMQVKKAKVNEITPKITSIVASDTAVKYLAQRAIVSYIKAIFLFADKGVFQAREVNLNDIARGFGLPTAPKIKIPQSDGSAGVNALKVKAQNQFGYRPHGNKNLLFEGLSSGKDDGKDEEDDDDLLVLKKPAHAPQLTTAHPDAEPASDGAAVTEKPRKRKKTKLNPDGTTKTKSGQHLRFDNDEEEDSANAKLSRGQAFVHDSDAAHIKDQASQEAFLNDVQDRLKQQDALDRQLQKERVREKHRKDRVRKRRDDDMQPTGAVVDADDIADVDGSEEPDNDISENGESSSETENLREEENLGDDDELMAMNLLSGGSRF